MVNSDNHIFRSISSQLSIQVGSQLGLAVCQVKVLDPLPNLKILRRRGESSAILSESAIRLLSLEIEVAHGDGTVRGVGKPFAQSIQKNLGIKVGLKELPINAFNNELATPKTRPLLWGYTFGFDYPDAQELDEYLGISGAPYNYEGYSNKRYDALVAKANADSNQKRRAQLYAQAENVRLADAPTVPLYFVNQNWLAKPNVTGFGYSPLYMHPWRQVSIH